MQLDLRMVWIIQCLRNISIWRLALDKTVMRFLSPMLSDYVWIGNIQFRQTRTIHIYCPLMFSLAVHTVLKRSALQGFSDTWVLLLYVSLQLFFTLVSLHPLPPLYLRQFYFSKFTPRWFFCCIAISVS